MTILIEKAYEINTDDMTIENSDSNGPKDIYSWYFSSDDVHPHVQYINDDGRIWAQAVTWDEINRLEAGERTEVDEWFEEAAYEAADYGMEVVV